MLTFAAFTPHPPIIIPEIGQSNVKYARSTIAAMESLSKSIEPCDIDTVIFVSPHTVLSPESMMISYAESASGDFGSFEHTEIKFKTKIDLALVREIIETAEEEGIPLRMNDYNTVFSLDHGILVPYYYLQNNLPSSHRLIVVGFSALSRINHLAFGHAISKVSNKSDQNIALIASGDLSHRILDRGSDFIGKKFDQNIVEAVTNNRIGDILNIDESLQEEAGECGYRSLLVLLGALDGLRTKPKLLSYEAPFGVGYMVANMGIKY